MYSDRSRSRINKQTNTHKQMKAIKNFVVRAEIPTHHQLNALRLFGPVKARGNGRYFVEVEFDTEEQAMNYLNERLHSHFVKSNMVISKFEECMKSVSMGRLSMCDVTGRIEERTFEDKCEMRRMPRSVNMNHSETFNH